MLHHGRGENDRLPNTITDASSGTLDDASVTTAKLADSSVTSAKIAATAITSGKIASSAVTAGKVATNAVTTNKIADDAVTSAKIATLDANLAFGDNVKALFGDFGGSGDLEVYHDGTANKSIINDAGSGDLEIQAGGTTLLSVGPHTGTYGQFGYENPYVKLGAKTHLRATSDLGADNFTPIIFYDDTGQIQAQSFGGAPTGCWKVRRGDGTQHRIAGTNATDGFAMSDDALKFNEVAMSLDGIATVKLLQPKRYQMKHSTIIADADANGVEQLGLIAQEVEAISDLACLVGQAEDPMDNSVALKTLNYAGITVLNTKALQELITRVESAEARLAALGA